VRSHQFVQKVLIRILDHLYEPQFLDCSHGFRPGRSQHTCLKQLQREFWGALWYIVGDLSGRLLDHPAGSLRPGWKRATGRATGRPDRCKDRSTLRLTHLGFGGLKKHSRCFFPTDLGASMWFSKAPLGLVPQQKVWQWPKRTLPKRMALQLGTRLPLLGFARFRALALLTTSHPGVGTHGGLRKVHTTGLNRPRCVRPSSDTEERLWSHFIRDSRFNKRLRLIGGLASQGGGRLPKEGQKGNTSAERLNRPQNGGHLKNGPLVSPNGEHATLRAPYCPLLANMQLHELDKFVLRLKHILEGQS
jgi:hypothetical protein